MFSVATEAPASQAIGMYCAPTQETEASLCDVGYAFASGCNKQSKQTTGDKQVAGEV